MISDMQAFLSKPGVTMLLKSIPESYQPNVEAIWDYYKRTGGSVPDGCEYIPAEVKFSYTTTENHSGTDANETERETEAGSAA